MVALVISCQAESVPNLLAVDGSRQQVPSRAEVLGNGTIRGKEPLGLPGRLEPLPAPLALPGELMGVFRPVIQAAMLAVFHSR
jgi:hypothetical protein